MSVYYGNNATSKKISELEGKVRDLTYQYKRHLESAELEKHKARLSMKRGETQACEMHLGNSLNFEGNAQQCLQMSRKLNEIANKMKMMQTQKQMHRTMRDVNNHLKKNIGVSEITDQNQVNEDLENIMRQLDMQYNSSGLAGDDMDDSINRNKSRIADYMRQLSEEEGIALSVDPTLKTPTQDPTTVSSTYSNANTNSSNNNHNKNKSKKNSLLLADLSRIVD